MSAGRFWFRPEATLGRGATTALRTRRHSTPTPSVTVLFRDGRLVRQRTVNAFYVGSNPTLGAVNERRIEIFAQRRPSMRRTRAPAHQAPNGEWAVTRLQPALAPFRLRLGAL